MRIKSDFRGLRGWLSMWERTIRFRHMRNKQEVDRRVKILGFWKEYGEQATEDAFGISRRTLFRWQAALGKRQGHLDALDPKSTAPQKKRRREVLPEVERLIIAERTAHPRYGKKKLKVFLKEEGYDLSESYIGRVIAALRERKLLPSGKKISFFARTGEHHEKPVFKRKKLRRQMKRGMELDTIVRFIDVIKRYILTAIDVEKKFDFLKRVIEVCPFPIDELQTDNGSEFALNFEQACTALGLTHFNTHPRSPKENPFVERFNRTISEDFIMLNRPLLRDDVSAFNKKLVDWLLWYNTERPHESIGMVSPLRYIVSTLTAEECQMWWTRT